MAEGLLRSKLDDLCVRAVVRSAGLWGGDSPAARGAVAAMSPRGIDISDHRSTAIDQAEMDRVDLVIGMAREHVREVVALDPSTWPRTFTLRELVRRGEQAGSRAPGQPFEEWLAKVHVGRERVDLLGESSVDDIADPVGGPQQEFESTAGELDSLLGRLVDLVWAAA